ncbi:hypothetical protein GH5_01079 [Leishmania sp. Ghana 2012 LV757]|uniref:hypothetical protein n=1 Tax=Leishmania sp. Ghana 2012 LV757 TaxID=2803181 RepID=UPI001B4678B8|nr:hypothetical protein GH5_01079 [Leishmania sp. Ghana 2012 LV757]
MLIMLGTACFVGQGLLTRQVRSGGSLRASARSLLRSSSTAAGLASSGRALAGVEGARHYIILGTPSTPLRTPASGSSSHYRPFSSEDEAALASVLSSKPRHVARHIRQSMLQSRRRIAQFRNAVTYLMISLQSRLQRKEMPPEDATAIMESLMRECVDLRQGDMAHLLFRAAIRFRKYGLTITSPFVRYLYESYKRENAKELMRSMAEELKTHDEMKVLAVLAYQFSGQREESVALWEAVPKEKITTGDYCAVLEGMGITGCFTEVVDFAERVVKNVAAKRRRDIDLNVVVSRAVIASRGSSAAVNAVVRLAKDHELTLSDVAVGALARSRLQERSVTSMADVYKVEAALCAELNRASLGMAGDSAVITKSSEIMVRNHESADDVMLQKVQYLGRMIEDAINNDTLDDVDALCAWSVIRGFGVLGRFEEMRRCFDLLDKVGVVKDHKLYDEMLRWYAHAYNLKEVIALKEEMTRKEVYHTTQTYQNVFRVLDRYYPRLVEKYLAEMRGRGMQVDGPMYPTLIRAFHALGDYAKVEELFRDAKQKAAQGTTQSMSPALIVQMLRCYPKDVVRGDAIVADAEEYGLLSYEVVQAEVLNHYALNDRPEAMQAFMSRIPHKTANVYRVLLRNAAQHRNRAQFNNVLQEMEAKQIPLNERLFSVIVTSLAHFQDTEGVRAYVHKALASNQIHTPLFFADVASAFERLGDVDAVDRCWAGLLETKMTITMPVYNRFLDVYMALNNMAKVQEILDTMMKLVPPNPVTATTVVDMLGKMGRLTEMEAILDEMSKSTNAVPTLVTYHQAMSAYAKCGDVTNMEAVREKLKLKGFHENAVTYNILFEGYGRAKRFEHLLELVEERKERGIPMEEFGYVVLLNTYARARMPAEAEALVDEIVSGSNVVLSSRLLATVASTFSQTGNLDQMQRYISLLLSHPECRLRDVESVYIIYARLRDTVKLQELLDAPKLPKTAFIYNTCVSAFARAGEHAKVAFLLTEMEHRGFALTRNTSIVLSSLLLKAGKLELAQMVLKWKGVTTVDVEVDSLAAANGAAASFLPEHCGASAPLPVLDEGEVDSHEAELLLRSMDDPIADKIHVGESDEPVGR